jgi:DNA polymerase V
MPFHFVCTLAVSGQTYPFFEFRVPAGFPSPAHDHLEQQLSLDELLDLRAPHVYLVRVSGDSLIGAGIFDGDLLVVNRARDAKSGDIVVATLNNEPLVKRFCRETGQVVLRSENPRYAPRYVLDGDELEVWGVVAYSVRSHGNA